MMLKTLCILPLCFILSHQHEFEEFKDINLRPAASANPKLLLQDLPIQPACIPILWNKQMEPEQLARIEIFQKEWFNTDHFKDVKLTDRQRFFLYNMTVRPLPRIKQDLSSLPRDDQQVDPSETGSSGRQKRHAGVPDCYEIPDPLRTRKEYRQLSYWERVSFHTALNAMKTDFSLGSVSAYDIFVQLHHYTLAPSAHSGPGFLPWHRQFLFTFENALYQYGYSGSGLPYWDSTLDQSLPDPSDSALWTSSYMGNNNGDVVTGPAAGWTMIPACQLGGNPDLRRTMPSGGTGQTYLLSDTDINNVLGKQCFADISCGKDCTFESRHGSVHVYVGGQMGSISCSPSDPVFFMHHAFVDCTWETFRQHQDTDREVEYPSSVYHGDNVGSTAHEWYSPMEPFEGLINAHGLSNHYTNYYYQCKNRPKTCINNNQCGSSILWCDTTACRCRAKVRQGGDCTGLPSRACAGPCFPKWSFPHCDAATNTCICKPLIIWATAANDKDIELPNSG